MIKIEEKTKIIVIDGEPGMLLLEFAVITRDLKKILPKGFAEKLEEASEEECPDWFTASQEYYQKKK